MQSFKQPVSQSFIEPKKMSLFQKADDMEERAGVVLFETQTPLAKGKSLLGQSPRRILKGHFPAQIEMLRDALKELQSEGHLDGALVGWVTYEGQFVFGVYPSLQHVSAKDLANSECKPLEPRKKHVFEPQMSQSDFCERVNKVKQYIAAGDIYQVNLSYPWLAKEWGDVDLWDFYRQLRYKSPAPFGAYLNLEGMEVASSSPESFLSIKGQEIQTKPIKGTRPRGQNSMEDAQLEEELRSSAKEKAELVMITDLERNDLGQVCEFGTVQVTELLKLEKYAQVQHLVSTVQGKLRKEVDHFDALAACFPGGSITGAPKVRAREVIEELELGPRKLYTGAIGYFGANGESQFSIAIRTAWKEQGLVRFDTGAGIVADSDPTREWEETLHKAAGLLSV